MTTEIKIARPQDDVLIDMEAWLRENIGLGSYRTIKNGFMGMDDWFYYDDVDEDDGMTEDYLDVDDLEDVQENIIFVFRRAADATIFALKWTTTTT
jgi:hypothetical protein